MTHDPGVSQHVTVAGHSYGSTTVADAFANSGMRADNAILLGSPGTDVAQSAADFGVDGGQVYIGDASTDPVGWLGQLGNTLPGEINDSLGSMVGPTAGLGADPAFEDFGATRFRAEVPGADMIDPGTTRTTTPRAANPCAAWPRSSPATATGSATWTCSPSRAPR